MVDERDATLAANTMDGLRFVDSGGVRVTPREWLQEWSGRYPDRRYSLDDHDRLIAKAGALCATDFEQIGKWKDAAQSEKKWRRDVASVAHAVWMQAAEECPQFPGHSEVAEFLREWSERSYTSRFSRATIQKRFGLSRATTLLYFLSAGEYPIFDSRVRRAVRRLRGAGIPNTVEAYLSEYCPFFSELAQQCNTTDHRSLDRALFSYGAKSIVER